MALTAGVVIVTYNRPRELHNALERWHGSARSPDQFVVVDASPQAPARREPALDRHAHLFSTPGSDYVVTGRPSITAQRNLAVDRLRTDVALFVDDDTLVAPEYLGRVAEVYELDGQARIAGVGGISYRRQRLPARLARTGAAPLRRYARRMGIPAAVTMPDQPPIPAEVRRLPVVRVRSLHGCAMSFRTELLRGLRFDETLRGYGFCEDFDMSFRASRTQALVVRTDALVHHTIRAGSTVPSQQYFFMQWLNPAYLTMKLYPFAGNERALRRLLRLERARARMLALAGRRWSARTRGWSAPPATWFEVAEEMERYLFASPAAELVARYRALEGLVLEGSPLLGDARELRSWLEPGGPEPMEDSY